MKPGGWNGNSEMQHHAAVCVYVRECALSAVSYVLFLEGYDLRNTNMKQWTWKRDGGGEEELKSGCTYLEIPDTRYQIPWLLPVEYLVYPTGPTSGPSR